MPLQVSEIIGLLGIVVFLGFFAEIIFKRFSIPSIIILLLIGLGLGPLSGTFLPSEISGYALIFSPVALIILLFEGGMSMRISSFLKDAPWAFTLATANIIVSIVALSVICSLFLGWDPITGAILGAIVGGTSSPIIIKLMENSDVRKKVKNTLTLESISTDVLCIVFAIAFMNIALGNGMEGGLLTSLFRNVFTAFSTGILLGVIGAFLWAWIIKNFKPQRFDYILTLGFVFIIYAVSEALGGNGAISSLLFGLIFANLGYISHIIKSDAFKVESAPIKQFHQEISFFIGTFFIVYLGMIVSFDNLNYFVLGVLFSILLIALRYLAVPLVTAHKDGFTKPEISLMSMVSARGLAAAILAPLPFLAGIPNTDGFSDIVFVVILISVISTTLGYLKAKFEGGLSAGAIKEEDTEKEQEDAKQEKSQMS